MTSRYEPCLSWIDRQHDRMCGLLKAWSEINTGSLNRAGITEFAGIVKREFAILGGDIVDQQVGSYKTIDATGASVKTPLADAVSITCRPECSRRVFLGIHLDTVYGPDHPFQKSTLLDANRLNGPGVADAKGGLVVMLIALQAFEMSPLAKNLGWEVLLNTDEELGSPGSSKLLIESAGRNEIGLVFEPALADGTLVGERKGSGNFVAIVQGRSAHAGRDFHLGRNAIHAAAEFVIRLDALNRKIPGATFNVGKIDGGGPVNVVPDLAICRFNVRVPSPEIQRLVEIELNDLAKEIGRYDGISLELSGGFSSPPKMMDAATVRLFERVVECGKEIGLNLRWQSSGGASDGNKLAAAGLPVIDTLGPRGGNLHSSDEFCLLDSLTERAKLTVMVLMKTAEGAL